MALPGYAGTILHVDLTSGKIRKEPLNVDLAREYIGGAGINNKLAYELIHPDVEPLSPDNAIIIGTGPFNGTMIPGSSEVMIMHKSPLNGAFPHTNGGGYFSHFLKSSGYDHVVIAGRSNKPVYLKIHDDSVELCPATGLWGKDVFETTDELRQKHGPCSVIPIGQAGENLVNISVTQIDKGGTLGSAGLAAVMGSKNLKALVAMMGTKSITVANPKKLRKVVDELWQRIREYHLRGDLLEGGSFAMTANWVIPVLARNSSVLVSPPPETKALQDEIYKLHKRSRKKVACASCPMCDKDRIDLQEKGMTTYDTAVFAATAIMTAFPAYGHRSEGSPLDRYADALRYLDITNRYGIDRVYSLQGLVDFVVTLYEDGVITEQDTGGIALDRSMDTLLKLTEMVAFRSGFGDILADGIIGAARRIGKGVDKYVQNVIKGQALFTDPRMTGLGPLQFEMLVYPGRALGVAAAMGAPSYSPNWPVKELIKQAHRCGMPEEAIKRIYAEDSFNVGRMAKHGEDFFHLFDMMGQCHRLYISRFYSMDILAELYSAVTGIEATATDIKKSSERAWNLWKVLNCRAGFGRMDDEPPDIWFQPLKGPDAEFTLKDYFLKKELTRADVEGMLDDYYDEHGWDKKTSCPTPDKLKELGLGYLVSTMAERQPGYITKR